MSLFETVLKPRCVGECCLLLSFSFSLNLALVERPGDQEITVSPPGIVTGPTGQNTGEKRFPPDPRDLLVVTTHWSA